MINHLPVYISLTFGLTTLATLLLFVWVIRHASSEETQKKAMPILLGLSTWLLLQSVLTLNHVYSDNTEVLPPRIVLFGILPTIAVVVLLFVTEKGRAFVDSLPLKNLTYLNIVRVPVELVLFWLYLHHAIPGLMTFEGRNFDILAGITAPIVAYFGLTKGKMSKQGILIWNVVCLGLLINIVVNALFSAPSPIQQFAFDQPNIAILHFPFSWLPTFVVPVVLFGHLVSIRQLLKNKESTSLYEESQATSG